MLRYSGLSHFLPKVYPQLGGGLTPALFQSLLAQVPFVNAEFHLVYQNGNF